MGLSFPSVPSLSEIRDKVAATVTNASESVRDFGTAAVQRTAELGRAGVDLGRRAVDAVRNTDVREAAAVVRREIGEATEAGRDGIRQGVEWAGRQTHEVANAARSQVTGDGMASRALRGAITQVEHSTRFQVGFVGGVAREAVGLVGTVGQLGTTVAEMRLSPEANAEYSQALVSGAANALEATGSYASSVAADPTRVGRDLSDVADAGRDWGSNQIDRYDQAIREGRGPETIGMDVGTVATYVVPVGGGPARGLATAAVRESGEALARTATQTLTRETGEALVREGVETTVRQGTETAARTGELAAGPARSAEALTEAGSVRRVNPQYPAAGHTQNCVECVIATERRFAGDLTATASSTAGPLPISRITDTFGGTFQQVSGPSEIGSILSASGDGARGIVYGADNARGFGHVWNVRFDNGVVRFLDGQPGAQAGLGVGNFDHFTDFQFLLTQPGR